MKLMDQKGFAPILIITGVIVMLGLLGGAYYFGKLSIKPQNSVVSSVVLQEDNSKTTLSQSGKLLGKMAFIRQDNLWVLVNGTERQLTTDAVPAEIPFWSGLPKVWYSNPQVSSDGTQLAFLKNVNTDSRQLYISELGGTKMKKLADDVEWTFPVFQWSQDSQKIFYVGRAQGQADQEGRQMLKVKGVNISTNAVQEYGQFAVQSGCGGASSDMADHLAAGENINSVGGGVMVFVLLPDGKHLIHSIACTGVGLGLLNLENKQDSLFSDKAQKGVISPNGKTLAYIENNKIMTMDLVSGGSLNSYTPSQVPVVLLWDPSGKNIYYSSDKLAKEVNLDDNIAIAVWGSSPMSYRINTASLWVLSLDTQKDKKLLETDTHALKPLGVVNNQLVFVKVENATRLFDNTKLSSKEEDLVKYFPKVSVQEIDIETLKEQMVVDQAQQSSPIIK